MYGTVCIDEYGGPGTVGPTGINVREELCGAILIDSSRPYPNTEFIQYLCQ